jgi:hypothetical protein
MTIHYYLKNISTLLTSGFTEEELRRFCFEEPTFKPLHPQLARSYSQINIIDRLLEYAEQKSQLDILLTWAEKENPA